MENLAVIHPEDRREESICPTCHQKIEKKIVRDDIRKVILVFKMASGYDKADKSWDTLFFARYTKAAKQLIQFLGSWEKACDCIQETVERFEGLGRSYTMETIITHSASWKKDHQEKLG